MTDGIEQSFMLLLVHLHLWNAIQTFIHFEWYVWLLIVQLA